MIKAPDRNDRRSLRLQIRTDESATSPVRSGAAAYRRTRYRPAVNELSSNRRPVVDPRGHTADQSATAAVSHHATESFTHTAC